MRKGEIEHMKRENGITIIALVVTIIILLILAGVSINMLVGDNGIIKKAQQAKKDTIFAGQQEQEQLNQLFEEMEKTENGIGSGGGDSQKDEIIELLQKQVEELKTQVIEKENTIQDLQNQWGNIETQLGETNAEASHVLKDYKAYSKGQLVTGTMANNGSVNANLNAGQSYTIPKGYHNGSGKVTAKDLASQTQATANANNLSNGVTAWVNGQKITGNGTDVNNSYNNGYNVGYGANNKTVHVYNTSAEYDAGYWWYRAATQGVDLAKKWPNNYQQLVLFQNLFPIVDQDNHNVASSNTGATTYTWRYDASTGKLYQDRGGLGHNSPCAVTVYAVF